MLSGDLAQVTAILTEDIVVLSDGGGKRPAAIDPLVGDDRAGRFLLGLARRGAASVRVKPVTINTLPGFIVHGTEGIEGAWALEPRGDRVAAIYVIRNPEKLGGLSR